MPWVKLDDTFWSNRELQRLSDKAYRLYMRAIGYSSQYLTDGVLDATDLETIGAPRRLCEELAAADRWDRLPDGRYQIHDYLEYQPSREQVLERRRKETEKKAGQRSGPNKHPESGRYTA